MGLYDWVYVDYKCPNCKKLNKNGQFQTYDFGRTFNEFEIGKKQGIIENGACDMLDVCKHCKCFVHAWLRIKDWKIISLDIYRYEVDLNKRDIINKGKHFNKETRRFSNSEIERREKNE